MKTLILAALFVMTAVPAGASIQLNPSYIDFFDQPVGISGPTLSSTIMNLGPKDIRYLQISPTCGVEFNVRTYSCYGPMRPYQTCDIEVTFTPYYEGYYNCTIYINSDNGSETLWVSGRGVKYTPLSQDKTNAAPAEQVTEDANPVKVEPTR